MKLSAQHCRPLPKGSPALSAKAAKAFLKDIPGWSVKGKLLSRKCAFKTYEAGVAFTNAVVWIAQAEDHHPDIALGYKEVTVTFTTHSVRGLSLNDFIAAAKVNALLD